MTYEETALAGALTEEQLDKLVMAFVRTADVHAIASALDLPVDLVLRALEDGTLVARALSAKRYALAMRFIAKSMDRLQFIIESPASSPREVMWAVEMLKELLGVQPPRAVRVVEVEAPAAPAEPEPAIEAPVEEEPAPKPVEPAPRRMRLEDLLADI